MDSIYTKEELVEKIKQIDAMILDNNGIQTYSVGDGQGTQSVTRYSLSQLLELRDKYQAMLDSLNGGRKPYRMGVNF